MFTYNTMQTFIGVVGMQPLHMVAAPSDDPRRLKEFPQELVGHLARLIERGLRPRDIVVRDSIRNAMIVAMAIGGSTNVTLHGPEIARAADATLQSIPRGSLAACVAPSPFALKTACILPHRRLPVFNRCPFATSALRHSSEKPPGSTSTTSGQYWW